MTYGRQSETAQRQVVGLHRPPRKGVEHMARNGQWERVEPHLYRLKHQTPEGEWTTRYYVRFQDWKGVNRSFPAGTDLRGARSKKKLLLGENERRVDFDKGKVERLTFNGQTATWSWPQRNERSRMTSSC